MSDCKGNTAAFLSMPPDGGPMSHWRRLSLPGLEATIMSCTPNGWTGMPADFFQRGRMFTPEQRVAVSSALGFKDCGCERHFWSTDGMQPSNAPCA